MPGVYGYGGSGQAQGNYTASGNMYGGQSAPPRADYGGQYQGGGRGGRGEYDGDSRGNRGGDYGGDSRGSRGGDYGGDNRSNKDYGGNRRGGFGGDGRGGRGGFSGDNRGNRGEYGGGYTQGDARNRGQGGYESYGPSGQSDKQGDTRSRGQGGYDSYGPSGQSDKRGDNGIDDVRSGGQFGGGSDTVKVKQCDENCNETCDNARIYISGLPLDTTIDELRELFGGIGQVARIKQKRGYKDQWPWNIKLYTDTAGQNKGDAVLVYEDPSAAHSAGGFFNDHILRGHQIKVGMAEKSAPRPSAGGYGQGHGGYGGPDRRFGGGHRSRPY
ncbi:hypothetical protein KP509_19G014000 [Ceratopteris richardii]|nr:hypothetical protein KP509_19G014000 [Ceratopteris richardii]